jgi:hypothetical protein
MMARMRTKDSIDKCSIMHYLLLTDEGQNTEGNSYIRRGCGAKYENEFHNVHYLSSQQESNQY